MLEFYFLDMFSFKSSRCPKLDGYAIANFGVRVEHAEVKMIDYGGLVWEWSGLGRKLSGLVG